MDSKEKDQFADHNSALKEILSSGRPVSRRELLRKAVTGAAGLSVAGLAMGGLLPKSVLASTGRSSKLVAPGMGAAGTPLSVDGGPSASLHSQGETGNFNSSAMKPLAVGGGHGGNLGAVTAQLYGTGLFIGNEFENWSDATRFAVFTTIKNWGFAFVCPKVGGYGQTWYSTDAQLQGWKNNAHSQGIGFVPFIYSVPSTYARDAAICGELGTDCGIVVVDMEDEWAGYNSSMSAFGTAFRHTNPNTPIIVSGYGDPITRFGSGGWPFSQMAYWADCYGPQWYYGEWSEYYNYGVEAAINWGDNECAEAFGSSFPLSPELSIYSAYSSSGLLPNSDITTGENYSKNWKAPVFWWEYSNMNTSIAHACLA